MYGVDMLNVPSRRLTLTWILREEKFWEIYKAIVFIKAQDFFIKDQGRSNKIWIGSGSKSNSGPLIEELQLHRGIVFISLHCSLLYNLL